jgi:hypothetical protein
VNKYGEDLAELKNRRPSVQGTAGASRVTCPQCQLRLSIGTAKPVIREGVPLTRETTPIPPTTRLEAAFTSLPNSPSIYSE